MSRQLFWAPLLATALLLGCELPAAFAQVNGAAGACPPSTRKGDVVDNLHGSVIPDPYRWLEDQNSPETRAWIDAQDKCTEAVLKAVPGRDAITKRLAELLKVDTFGLPTIRPGQYFFAKRRADQELYRARWRVRCARRERGRQRRAGDE